MTSGVCRLSSRVGGVGLLEVGVEGSSLMQGQSISHPQSSPASVQQSHGSDATAIEALTIADQGEVACATIAIRMTSQRITAG